MDPIDELGYLIKVVTGSKRYNLDIETSDNDYFVVVDPRVKYPFELTPGIYNVYRVDITHEYFIITLDNYRNPVDVGMALTVTNYTAPQCDGGNEELKQFWLDHGEELCNINPRTTLLTTFETVSYYVDNDIKNAFSMAVRMLGIVNLGYKYQDISKAMFLDDEWRELYFSAKAGNMTFDDIRDLYMSTRSNDNLVNWYFNQPYNETLHNQYRDLIDRILS